MLAPLGDYGGPTKTMHPLLGSPVIQTGVSTRTGQRDFAVTGPLTLGAVQVSSPIKVSDEATLRAGLVSATLNPGTVICFDPFLDGCLLYTSPSPRDS